MQQSWSNSGVWFHQLHALLLFLTLLFYGISAKGTVCSDQNPTDPAICCCCLSADPWMGGRREVRAPPPLMTKTWARAAVPHRGPRVGRRFAGAWSAFAWGGFHGGHVCVQTFTYSNTGRPSRCSYECKLAAKGLSCRRGCSAAVSHRGERPHLLLKAAPQRRAKNSLDAVGKVSVLAAENGSRSRKDKNIKIS